MSSFWISEALSEVLEAEVQGLEKYLLPSATSSRIRPSWLLHLVFGHQMAFSLVYLRKVLSS